MPKKCYYKPNRARERVYTAKDVGRIARYALKDDTSSLYLIVAYVLVSLGLGYIVCRAAKTVHIALNIAGYFNELISAIAIGAFIDKLIWFATYGKYIPWPPLRALAFLLGVGLAFIQGIFNEAAKLVEDYADLYELATVLDSLCETVDVIEQVRK